MFKNKFSKTVIALSLVSLFADISSELLYPIIPLYLKNIGMSAVYIGILEGLADLISGLSKTFFGKWSDTIGKRMPFVWTGYILSSVSKSFIGIFVHPLWIVMTRSLDRLGKGIRTSSRDAILSTEANDSNKGEIFGFHRSMDTTGAFLGPVLALIYLKFFPGEYRRLFFYSLIPSIFVIFFLSTVKEKENIPKKESQNLLLSSFTYWKIASSDYKKVVILILTFTLLNSSDMFLLLRASEITHNDSSVILFYILYNIIFALTSYKIGKWSDEVGKEKVFKIGLILFSCTYFLMAVSKSFLGLTLAFIIYGLFSSCTEGVSKAWISLLCKKEDLGVALGFQNTTQSITAMFASLLAGLLWMKLGSMSVFIFSSLGSTLLFMKMNFNKK